MTCTKKKCRSERIAHFTARCKDMFWWKSDKTTIEGYVNTPGGELGGGDEVDIHYCLDCGTIQGEFPVASEYTKAQLEE